MTTQDFPIDELIKKTGSIYKLSIITARRAVELGDGAGKLVDAPSDAKPIAIALKEIMNDKISYKVKEEK